MMGKQISEHFSPWWRERLVAASERPTQAQRLDAIREGVGANGSGRADPGAGNVRSAVFAAVAEGERAMKLTPWFPSSVKPARVGVYQTRHSLGFDYRYWNGLCWGVLVLNRAGCRAL